jgi:hypothetical protein
MRIVLSAAVLAAMLFASSALADDAGSIDSTPERIRSEQAALRALVESKSGQYSYFTDDERKEILSRQDRVLGLIDAKTAISDLTPDDRIALANALAAVDAAVTRAEDNRLICERIKPLGSNRPQNKCMTVGQRRKLRDDAQSQGRGPER